MRLPAATAGRRWPGLGSPMWSVFGAPGCSAAGYRGRHRIPARVLKGRRSWLSGSISAGHGEMTYEEADAFSVTAGGFLLVQRQHSGEQTDLAVFAPDAWLYAEVARAPQPGSQ